MTGSGNLICIQGVCCCHTRHNAMMQCEVASLAGQFWPDAVTASKDDVSAAG